MRFLNSNYTRIVKKKSKKNRKIIKLRQVCFSCFRNKYDYREKGKKDTKM